MVGIEAVPAAIYLLAIFGIPKSPRWLIFNQKDYIKAEEIQKEMNMMPFTENEIKKIVASESSFDEKLFSAKYKFPVLLAFLLAFFNQLSGINAFLYYAPRIFETAGLKESSALLSSIGIGLTNLIFTLLGLYLIDRIGRKKLMFLGSIGYIVSLSMVGFSLSLIHI